MQFTHHKTDSTHSIQRFARGICCVALASTPLVFGSGCAEPLIESGDDVQTNTQGLSVMTELEQESDAEAFRFEIDEVSCTDGSLIEEDVEVTESDFEDMMLPGGIPTFENQPYDEDSNHLFGDQYFTLPAGCYDVQVTPLQSVNGPESDDCVGNSASGVEVLDGATTEIHLIAQCGNDPVGGLDVIASLNHAPQIEALSFQPSKFTKVCESTEVCLTATDPDGDPIEVAWTLTTGDDSDEEIAASSTTESSGSLTACAEIEADTAATYEYEATVFDLLHDEDSGQLIRYETHYDQTGEPNRESRDALEFPVHVGEDSGATCDLS